MFLFLFACNQLLDLNACLAGPADVGHSLQSRQSTEHGRVTVLGITRGTAFLASPAPVGDATREMGSHPVEWIRVVVFAEKLSATKGTDDYQMQLLTPEEKPFVEPVERVDKKLAERASSIMQSELSDPRLPAILYPVELPKSNSEFGSHVFVLTISGQFPESKTGMLVMSFTTDNGKRETFEFDVTVP